MKIIIVFNRQVVSNNELILEEDDKLFEKQSVVEKDNRLIIKGKFFDKPTEYVFNMDHVVSYSVIE